MKKIKILMYLNHPYDKANACTMYRNVNPFKYMKGVKVRYLNQVESQIDFDPTRKKVTSIKIDTEAVEWADIVVFSRHYDQVSLMGCLAEVAHQMGKIVIYETDDLLHKVEQNIGKVKVDNHDIKDQLRFVDWLIPNVDMMTVSTDYLKDFYEKKYHKPTFSLNNFYDPAIWRGMYLYKKLRDFWRKKIKGDKTIRIGWQGGNNHFLNNFNYIVEPLNALAKQYGKEIKFVAMAGQHPNLDPYGGEAGKRKFLEFDFEYRKPAPFNKFPRALAEMDLDIGLIVVEDNEFSRAKSNIKWLEYSLLGIPSIASNCLPYQETNAILVNNTFGEWYDAIERLMKNPKECAIIGKEAKRMTKAFDIRNHAQKWLDAYRRALAGKLN